MPHTHSLTHIFALAVSVQSLEKSRSYYLHTSDFESIHILCTVYPRSSGTCCPHHLVSPEHKFHPAFPQSPGPRHTARSTTPKQTTPVFCSFIIFMHACKCRHAHFVVPQLAFSVVPTFLLNVFYIFQGCRSF